MIIFYFQLEKFSLISQSGKCGFLYFERFVDNFTPINFSLKCFLLEFYSAHFSPNNIHAEGIRVILKKYAYFPTLRHLRSIDVLKNRKNLFINYLWMYKILCRVPENEPRLIAQAKRTNTGWWYGGIFIFFKKSLIYILFYYILKLIKYVYGWILNKKWTILVYFAFAWFNIFWIQKFKNTFLETFN